MALPKMSVPRYTVELPSTGEKLNMRPYLVKEEKVLMIALESNDPMQISEAVRSIIQSCYDLESMDNLTVFDIEMLFLQLRAKSVGEEMKIQIKCKGEECGIMNPLDINIDDIKIHKPDSTDGTILFGDSNGVGIKMKYPTAEVIGKLDPEKIFAISSILSSSLSKIILLSIMFEFLIFFTIFQCLSALAATWGECVIANTWLYFDISTILSATTPDTLPLKPLSTSSNIIVLFLSFLDMNDFIISNSLDNSPPDATFLIEL